jgi:hypothetical protein
MFSFPRLPAVIACAVAFVVAVASTGAQAARVGVLANKNAQAVAADFTARIAGHTFTAVDLSTGTPSPATLIAAFDVILLFEDGLFEGSHATGDAVYQFAMAGHPVVLSTFYDQDRSDRTLGILGAPHGWGNLETIDPNTTDGLGTAYAARTLAPASIAEHPLTAGVHTLFADDSFGFAGGNQAKPGTTVLATWTQPNLNGRTDPAITLRKAFDVCVMQIGIAPDYASYGAFGTAYGGDFYQVWKNAFDYGGTHCGIDVIVPTLGDVALALTAVLLAALGAGALRRRPH